jgi:DNA-binding NarL/FixJ family response regulator
MSELCILLVGSTSRPEFHDARPTLESFGQVTSVPDTRSAQRILAERKVSPDLMVIVQAYPGQFSGDAIDKLRRMAPLARVVALLGSWCEGEMRTGKPWPAAIRVYWHGWESQATQQLGRLCAGSRTTWSLPPTSSEEERILASADEPYELRQGRIAVCSGQFEMQDWLSAACRRRGYSTLRIGPGRWGEPGDLTAVIFDATDGGGEERETLDRLVSSLAGVPIVVLLDFPRVEDRSRMLHAGARAVLAKPLMTEDLFWQLDRVREIR